MKNPLSPLKTVIGFLSDYRRKKLDLKVVKDETNLNDRSALRVLRKLTSEGLLELIDEGKLFFGHKSGVYKKNPTWKIVDRQAIANRHKPRGKASPIRDRIWKAIRIKRIFLVKDIMKLADVKETSAMGYVHILRRNKYVRKVGKRSQREGCHWQLIRNPGPNRPLLEEYPKKKKNYSASNCDAEGGAS